ncbi:type-F conjugative transfer system pilin assembly protein TrbC [Thiomicrorhabdus hydrogeniphila]
MKSRFLVTLFSLAMLSNSAFATIEQSDLDKIKAQNAEALKKAQSAYEKAKPSQLNLGAIPTPQARLKGGFATSAENYGKQLKGLSTVKNPTNKLNLFISFSMPESSIKKYIKEAAKLGRENITLTLIGLKQGLGMKDTSAVIGQLTKGVDVVVEINPPAFERFNITTVPTLVVYYNDPLYEAKCATGQQPEKKDIEHYEGVIGDVSISYALEKMLDKPDSQFKGYLQEVLHKLKPSVL